MHQMIFFVACRFFTSISNDFQRNSLGGASGQTCYVFSIMRIHVSGKFTEFLMSQYDLRWFLPVRWFNQQVQNRNGRYPLESILLQLFPNSSLFCLKIQLYTVIYIYIYREDMLYYISIYNSKIIYLLSWEPKVPPPMPPPPRNEALIRPY